jgi:signal transduction histidine kinase
MENMIQGEKDRFIEEQKGWQGFGLEAPDELRTLIAGILQKRKPEIIEQYYEDYCRYIGKIDKKKRDLEHLKIVCIPVKKRFSKILDRFINFLASQDRRYDLRETEQDEEYALRFVVPGRNKEMNSHDVIMTTESIYRIATTAVLNELNPAEYSTSREAIMNIMNGLIYVTFEDLWVSSVAGFRAQHSVIQQLLSKLMRTQEEERQNLWREIHDDLLQILAVIPLKIEIIEELAQKNVPAMKKELNWIKNVTKKTARKIRNLCHGFNLFWVERKGFAFSLRTFTRLLEEEFGLPVELHICTEAEKINGFPGVVLFRIIQEGLYNVAKHSKAGCAKVAIDIRDMNVVSTLEDNGLGFDVQSAIRKNSTLQHLGLVFMKERAKLLNGSLEIDSKRGSGTRMRISIPLSSFSKGAFSRKAQGG